MIQRFEITIFTPGDFSGRRLIGASGIKSVLQKAFCYTNCWFNGRKVKVRRLEDKETE